MEFKVKNEFITLGQLLKACDFISSGAQAKFAVKELEIKSTAIRKTGGAESCMPVIRSLLKEMKSISNENQSAAAGPLPQLRR